MKTQQHAQLPQYLVEAAQNCDDPGITAHLLKTSRDCGFEVDRNQLKILNSIIAQQQQPAKRPERTQSWLAMVAN